MIDDTHIAGTANRQRVLCCQGFEHLAVLNTCTNCGCHISAWVLLGVGASQVKVLTEFNTLQVMGPDSDTEVSIGRLGLQLYSRQATISQVPKPG